MQETWTYWRVLCSSPQTSCTPHTYFPAFPNWKCCTASTPRCVGWPEGCRWRQGFAPALCGRRAVHVCKQLGKCKLHSSGPFWLCPPCAAGEAAEHPAHFCGGSAGQPYPHTLQVGLAFLLLLAACTKMPCMLRIPLHYWPMRRSMLAPTYRSPAPHNLCPATPSTKRCSRWHRCCATCPSACARPGPLPSRPPTQTTCRYAGRECWMRMSGCSKGALLPVMDRSRAPVLACNSYGERPGIMLTACALHHPPGPPRWRPPCWALPQRTRHGGTSRPPPSCCPPWWRRAARWSCNRWAAGCGVQLDIAVLSRLENVSTLAWLCGGASCRVSKFFCWAAHAQSLLSLGAHDPPPLHPSAGGRPPRAGSLALAQLPLPGRLGGRGGGGGAAGAASPAD